MARPATPGQITWPSLGTSADHQRAHLMAADGQNLLAVDNGLGWRRQGNVAAGQANAACAGTDTLSPTTISAMSILSAWLRRAW